MSIQAANYEVEDMGRYFKSSKKKYRWTFFLDEKQHMLELEFSYLSGKRRLVLDARVLHESMMLTSSFQYPFTLEGFALNVIQQGDAFELRINNKVFSHLYTQQKTQNEFVYDEKLNTNKTDNFYSDPPNFNNQFSNNFPQNTQKINLNIKFDNPKEPTHQPKPQTAQQIKSQQFGQPNMFEEFEQFGQASKPTTSNPFGDSFNVGGGFSNQPTAVAAKSQPKVDLLDLDEAPPQPKQQSPQQPVQVVQPPQQQQTTSPFDAFNGSWTQPQQQPLPVQQPVQQQQTNLFDAFAQAPIQQQTQQPQQVFMQPQQAQFQQQQQFAQPFQQQFQQQQPPQPQPNLNILNLYGSQPQNIGNLAYTAFPPVQQTVMPVQVQGTQQPIQQQPTPFDLFK